MWISEFTSGKLTFNALTDAMRGKRIGEQWPYLRKVNFQPKCFVDVGANRGDWTRETLRAYPDASIFMFEANEEHQRNYGDILNNKNVRSHIGILLSETKEVKWWKLGDGSTGDSIYKETDPNLDFKSTRKIATTLDNVLQRNEDYCQVDFIKIDVQGAELDVLKGASNSLKTAKFVLLEMPFFGEYNQGAPKFAEYVAFMDKHGFAPFEITEQHRIRKFLRQIDFIFISESYGNSLNLS